MTSLPRALSRAAAFLGVDRATAYATLASMTPLLFGPVTALLVATRLTADTQGFYYTFGSLMAVQSVVEVGLGQAIIQIGSHEWAALRLDRDGWIVGAPDPRARLIGLGRQALAWYGLLAGAMVVVLGVAGSVLLAAQSDAAVRWREPWLASCAATGVGLAILPPFYLMQACNHLSEFWLYRWIQQAANGLTLWVALALGAALWAPALAAATGVVWSIAFLWYRHRWILANLRSAVGGARVSWRREVWPLQWRVGAAWISIYASPQAFVPILFIVAGPVVAGRMGLTLTLGGVIIAISSAWVVTKAPWFGVLVAQGRLRELDAAFAGALARSVAVALIGAGLLWGGVVVLGGLEIPLRDRILSPVPAGMLLAGSVLTCIIVGLSTYLRAYKREPLASVLVLGSLATIILGLILARRWGATGTLVAYLGVLVLYQLPVSCLVFVRRRRAWQDHG